jgi:soluble lytic murein transglycosylase-like protein
MGRGSVAERSRRTRRSAALLLAALALGCASGRTDRQPTVSWRAIPASERFDRVLPYAKAAAAESRLPLSLILGVIHVESRFRPDARSHAGAHGLMQLMPRTAASLATRLRVDGVAIDDPSFNVRAGSAYLSYLLQLFNGDRNYALAAYNAGPARARSWQLRGRAIPAFGQRYAAAVLAAAETYQKLFPADAQASLEGIPQVARQRALDEMLDRDALRALLRQRLFGERDDSPPAALASPLPQGGLPMSHGI